MATAVDLLRQAVDLDDLTTVQSLVTSERVHVDVALNDDSWTALHLACSLGRPEIVKWLIESGGANLESRSIDGMTPLHVACWEEATGGLATMKYLIGTCKANVEATTNDGHTVLLVACAARFFDLEMIQYLIEQGGANIEATRNDGSTPLLLACVFGVDDENQLDAVRYMVDMLGAIASASASACAADGSTCLHRACHRGKLELVRYLIELVRVNIEAKDQNGATSLHWAVAGGHLETVQYMVGTTVSADVNAADMHRVTILHVACHEGSRTIAQYLMEQPGVDVYAKSKSGCTAFHLACDVGDVEIVNRFLETYDDFLEQTTDEGLTGLHVASAAGRLEVVQCLLDAGAVVDAAVGAALGSEGMTALHFACRYGHILVVSYLIAHGGADPHAASFAAATALHYAVCGGSLDIVRYLVETCHVNVSNGDMHSACMYGFLEIVQYFVQLFGSAFINTRTTTTGQTCLHSACDTGQLEIARYLLSAIADRSGPANSIADTTATPSLAETMTTDGDLAIHMALHHYNRLSSASDDVDDNIGRNNCATKAFALVLLMVKHFPVN